MSLFSIRQKKIVNFPVKSSEKLNVQRSGTFMINPKTKLTLSIVVTISAIGFLLHSYFGNRGATLQLMSADEYKRTGMEYKKLIAEQTKKSQPQISKAESVKPATTPVPVQSQFKPVLEAPQAAEVPVLASTPHQAVVCEAGNYVYLHLKHKVTLRIEPIGESSQDVKEIQGASINMSAFQSSLTSLGLFDDFYLVKETCANGKKCYSVQKKSATLEPSSIVGCLTRFQLPATVGFFASKTYPSKSLVIATLQTTIRAQDSIKLEKQRAEQNELAASTDPGTW
jgi:hypothetical protein